MNKYELVPDDTIVVEGVTLTRIRALRDIPCGAQKGGLGGYIMCYDNLSQDGDCWVGDGSYVYGGAAVMTNARIMAHARVLGNAVVGGNAVICGNARVKGNALVSGNASINGYNLINGNVIIKDNAAISGYATIIERAVVEGNAFVGDNALVKGRAKIRGNASVTGNSVVADRGIVTDDAIVQGWASVIDDSKVYGEAKLRDVKVSLGSRVGGDVKMLRCGGVELMHADLKSNTDYIYISGFKGGEPLYAYKTDEGYTLSMPDIDGNYDMVVDKIKSDWYSVTHSEDERNELLAILDIVKNRLGEHE